MEKVNAYTYDSEHKQSKGKEYLTQHTYLTMYVTGVPSHTFLSKPIAQTGSSRSTPGKSDNRKLTHYPAAP